MRVIIVNKHRDDVLGGSEVQCDFIARGLQQRGHSVHYVAPSKKLNLSVSAEYSIVPVGFSGNDILNAIIKAKPDVVYWRFNEYFFRYIAKSLKKRSIPMVFAVASNSDLQPWAVKPFPGIRGKYKSLKSLVRSRWEFQGFHFVDTLTVNNSDFLGLVPVKNQHYIPNGMSSDFDEFKWPKPYFAWVSNIKPMKRPQLFVNLAKEFREWDVDFLMVGDIHDNSYLWLNDRTNLPDNFHYLGKKSLTEVSGFLKESIVHIHTCMPEGFPNVFIQAWLQGTPSISYGYNPSSYITEKNIGYYSENDWHKFVFQTRTLIENNEQRQLFGKNAKQFAREKFGVEELVQRVERVLSDQIK